MSFRLTCKCGRAYPVETRQAGGTISCECGETIQIPTMMKIKKLPVWEDGDESASSAAETEVSNAVETVAETTGTETSVKQDGQKKEPSETSPKKEWKMSAKRRGLLIVASIFFILGMFILGRNLHKPDPRSVFYKQISYTLDGKKQVRRDSSPITEEDFGFYYIQDQVGTIVIDDYVVDNMSFFYAYQYFNYVKSLKMSDNFYDNYEAILTRWKLWLATISIVTVIAGSFAAYALFSKESTKQVGTMRGEGWR